MHQIDTPGNVNGRWVPGNPEQGVIGTGFSASWQNSVQEEIANAVKAAGIELEKADETQLSQAMQIIARREAGGTGSGAVHVVGLTLQAPAIVVTDSEVTFTAIPELLLSGTTFGKCVWTGPDGAVIEGEEGLNLRLNLAGDEGDEKTVSCIAYDNYGNASQKVTHTATITLNSPPDVTNMTVTAPNGLFNGVAGDLVFSGAIDTDGDALYYRITEIAGAIADKTDNIQPDENIRVTPNADSVSVSFVAVDVMGLVSDVKSFDFDTSVPSGSSGILEAGTHTITVPAGVDAISISGNGGAGTANTGGGCLNWSVSYSGGDSGYQYTCIQPARSVPGVEGEATFISGDISHEFSGSPAGTTSPPTPESVIKVLDPITPTILNVAVAANGGSAEIIW